MRDDDLFANFERMRKQLDELFGHSWERVGVSSTRRRGFSPKIDVYYEGDPPVAVITADLAGIDIDDVALEVQGRRLVIAGERAHGKEQSRLYQQIEIEHGFFRRVIELGADVVADAAKASYEDGLLRIELPLAEPEKISLTPIKKRQISGDNR
ncbi:MAG TPA: Hsp20/alpha crystallin family protein [Solirubrobacterales bacterium]|jgi:HSP20 family protein|nr:Hsp20/alpha crystallin family protein [Solirubrobacterales bacterium]